MCTRMALNIKEKMRGVQPLRKYANTSKDKANIADLLNRKVLLDLTRSKQILKG